MRKSTFKVLGVLKVFLVAGCASTQLNHNTVEIASTVYSVYTDETLNNISIFIDDMFAIPSQVSLQGGTFQTTNTVSPSFTFPLAPQTLTTLQSAVNGAGAVTGLTGTKTLTTAGPGLTVGATNTASQNYTVAPLNDQLALRNQQALYRHAIWNEPLKGNYEPQRVFITDRFYFDPFHIQKPQCVLCAANPDQGKFVKDKYTADAAGMARLKENQLLKGGWVYWDNYQSFDPYAEKPKPEEMRYLGTYGRHAIYIKHEDYASGVLSDFIFATLSYAAPSETFSSGGGPQHIILQMQKIPVEFDQEAPHSGRVGPSKKNAVFPIAPSAGGLPATNTRVPPVERNYNLIIPQTIIPTQ